MIFLKQKEIASFFKIANHNFSHSKFEEKYQLFYCLVNLHPMNPIIPTPVEGDIIQTPKIVYTFQEMPGKVCYEL